MYRREAKCSVNSMHDTRLHSTVYLRNATNGHRHSAIVTSVSEHLKNSLDKFIKKPSRFQSYIKRVARIQSRLCAFVLDPSRVCIVAEIIVERTRDGINAVASFGSV